MSCTLAASYHVWPSSWFQRREFPSGCFLSLTRYRVHEEIQRHFARPDLKCQNCVAGRRSFCCRWRAGLAAFRVEMKSTPKYRQDLQKLPLALKITPPISVNCTRVDLSDQHYVFNLILINLPETCFYFCFLLQKRKEIRNRHALEKHTENMNWMVRRHWM